MPDDQATGPRERAPRRDAVANRRRILAAAVGTVKREGTRVPMASIAEDAGIGIGTLYRHFPTREDLMQALTDRSFELILANARAAAESSGSGLDALGVFFEQTIRDRGEFVLPWHGGPPVRGEHARRLQSEVWTLIDEILRRGAADGSVRDDLEAFHVIVFGAMLAQPLPGAIDWDSAARGLAEIHLAGMRPN